MFRFFKNSKSKRSGAGRKSKSSRGRRNRTFESLEKRQLMAADIFGGVLTITGGEANDLISVKTYDGVTAVVAVNNDVTLIPIADFNSVEIQGLGGNDTITYELGKTSDIYGGDGDDVITGGFETDHIYGDKGNDTLNGGLGTDHLHGGDQHDDLRGGGGIDYLYGDDGNDDLNGGTGHDWLIGSRGDDTYFFSGEYAGFDKIIELPGQGVDTLDFSEMDFGVRRLDIGTAGTQLDVVVDENGYSALNLHIASGSAIENVVGSDYDDYVLGNSLSNSLSGGDGNDYLYGRDGNDTLAGGNGHDGIYGGNHDDTLQGGAGNDGLFGDDHNDTLDGGTGDDFLMGGNGDDTYQFGSSFRGVLTPDLGVRLGTALGNDTIMDFTDVNGGRDTLDFSEYGQGIFVDLAETDRFTVASGFTLQILGPSPIENVTGSAYDDVIYGNERANTLKGMNGNDKLVGRDGNDYLDGGLGNDDVSGGNGVDQIFGGSGTNVLVGGADRDYFHFRTTGGEDEYDTLPDWFDAGDVLDFSEYDHGVTLNLNKTSDTTQDVAENLTLKIYHPWTVTDVLGSQLADVIEGNARANYINGEGGDDVIKGNDGNDTLYGGAGYDRLYGGNHDDTLNGGDDDIADFLVGGSGHDAFWAEWEYTHSIAPIRGTSPNPLLRWNRDQPVDFVSGIDRIV